MNSTNETLLFDCFLIMYNLCVFTCIIVMFVFHCIHVRISYVLNAYLLTYLQLIDAVIAIESFNDKDDHITVDDKADRCMIVCDSACMCVFFQLHASCLLVAVLRLCCCTTDICNRPFIQHFSVSHANNFGYTCMPYEYGGLPR